MKIRIADRLLVALAGLVLLALCASVVAQVFFQVPLTDYLASALATPGQAAAVVIVAVVAMLLIIGVYCVCLLFRHRKGKRGFVTQQTENGELSIAVKAMEGLVHQCVECHPEMELLGVSLEPGKDGVTVKLRINLASGVSIPLAVGALQKQIRTYVTSCSGVDVKEVCVQVETTSELATDSPYAVPGLMANPPALLREGDKSASSRPGEEERDERPIHQRLFGHDAQPSTVPTPPVEEAPAQAEPEAEAADLSEAENSPDETPEPEENVEETVTDDVPAAEKAEKPEAEEENTPDETPEPEEGIGQAVTDDVPDAEEADESFVEAPASTEPEVADAPMEENTPDEMPEPEESDEQAVMDDVFDVDQIEEPGPDEEPAQAAEAEETEEWAEAAQVPAEAEAEVDGHEVAE